MCMNEWWEKEAKLREVERLEEEEWYQTLHNATFLVLGCFAVL